MKTKLLLFAAIGSILTLNSCQEKVKPTPEPVQKTDVSEFLGQDH